MSVNAALVYLILTSHGILHYLWCADLSKSFFQLIVSICIFRHFFFSLNSETRVQ